MKLAPLTQEDVARTHWHINGYGLCRRLADGLVTPEQIREEIAQCPDQYREEFRYWLNLYRMKFKEQRKCRKGSGVVTSTGSVGAQR